VTKIGTGFSDEMLADLFARLTPYQLTKKRADYA
jgi:ATP-dependent DNA ligase